MKKLQASELRIGNLVKHDGKIGAVCVIYEDAINFTDETSLVGWYTLEFDSETELKPIPLTEDWLLRMGFKKEYEYYTFPGTETILLDPNLKCFTTGDDNCSVFFKTPEYVHQLQNLYFALTGEELTINAINETE